MAQYILEILIEASDKDAAETARDEIAERIEDAREADKLGGCNVSTGDLQEA